MRRVPLRQTRTQRGYPGRTEREVFARSRVSSSTTDSTTAVQQFSSKSTWVCTLGLEFCISHQSVESGQPKKHGSLSVSVSHGSSAKAPALVRVPGPKSPLTRSTSLEQKETTSWFSRRHRGRTGWDGSDAVPKKKPRTVAVYGTCCMLLYVAVLAKALKRASS